jgi:hypothetical protein
MSSARILCCLKEKNETVDHHVKWNKPDQERQIPHVLSNMWNLVFKDE